MSNRNSICVSLTCPYMVRTVRNPFNKWINSTSIKKRNNSLNLWRNKKYVFFSILLHLKFNTKKTNSIQIKTYSRVIHWGIGQNWTRVHQNPWNLAIWFIIQYHKTRIFLFWPKNIFCRFYEFLKNFGLAQKKIVNSRYWL
jgi:hypothetical protein